MVLTFRRTHVFRDSLIRVPLQLPMDSDVDLEHIAQMTEGFSGADLQALLSDTQLEAVHELLDNNDGSTTGKMPVITSALLKSIASNVKPSVSEAEKRRLYDIYSQFLDSKRSAAAQVLLPLSLTFSFLCLLISNHYVVLCILVNYVQSRDAKGKRATLA